MMKIDRFFRKSPISPILRLAREIEEQLANDLGKVQLSVWGAHVCVAIYFESRDCGISELARTLKVKRPRLSQILRELEVAGHIRRYNKSTSARSKYIGLTSKGERVSLKAVAIFDRLANRIEAGVGRKNSENIAEDLSSVSLTILNIDE